MAKRTPQQLAEAVLKRHRPVGGYTLADGTVGASPHCSDSGFIVWPCIEYELAMAVLHPEPEPAPKPRQGAML